MAVIASSVVPTEYDYWVEGLTHVLMDDRSRAFRGLTRKRALSRAEAAQDPTDPIHLPPYPSPLEVGPWPR